MPRRAARGGLAVLALALLQAAPSSATLAAEPAAEAAAPALYAPRIAGLTRHESRLEALLRDSGISFRLVGTPPETVGALRRRARQDLGRFDQILNSLGFYDGTVAFEVGDAPDGEPLPLVFTVDPGVVYLLGEVRLQRDAETAPTPAGDALLDELGLHIGMPAEAQPIIDAQGRLVTSLENDGHPFANVLDRRTVIDPERKTMVVTYRLDPGPKATFGDVRIDGLDNVDARHVRGYQTWKPGAAYDRRALDKMQSDLVATDLFRSVDLRPVEPVGDDGRVPIAVSLQERSHRSIGFGLSYATNVGPGAETFWEHRNLSGQGERLRLSIAGSPIEQGVEGRFRKPLFLDREQDLIADGELKNRLTDAFDEQRGAAFVGLERRLGGGWSVSAGPTLAYSQVEESAAARENFLLGGLRTGARRSTVDDPLNPSEGSKLELGATPYTSLDSQALRFVKTAIAGSAYRAIDDQAKFVVAARARIGSIVGGDPDELPAGMRFYAGGGGSVRGYEFQTVGPLNAAGDPIGGKSIVDMSAEFRARLTENIGIVPFVDAGNVYREQVPENLDLLWAAGIGVRYYTAVGPVRADIAFPIDKRDADDAFQFYFSLGQAF